MTFLEQLDLILISIGPSTNFPLIMYDEDFTVVVERSHVTVLFNEKSLIIPRDSTRQIEVDLSQLSVPKVPQRVKFSSPPLESVADEPKSTDVPGIYQIDQSDIPNKFREILKKSIPVKRFIFKQRYDNYFKDLQENLRIEVKVAEEWTPTLDFKPAKIDFTSRYYKWASNEVFVGFSNHIFGGGILEEGWVQEEQLVSCLELFVHILELQRDYTQLDKTPCIIKTKAFANPKIEYYGHEGLDKIERNSESNDVDYVADAVDIHWLSMAAINLGTRSRVTKTDITDMIRTAFRAFVLVGRNTEPTRINSGKWGAGVFGWEPEVSMLIQYVAFSYSGLPSKGHTLLLSTAGDKEFTKYTDVFKELNDLPDKSWNNIVNFIHSKC